jgi:hypothetical protein
MPSGNGKNVDSPLNQSRPGNESSEPSPQSPSSIAQPSRLRRTLLFAGVFALLAMVFVPTPKHGYRLIFDRSDTSIAFFQLLVNVAFAALVGALVANLPWRKAWFRRGLYVTVACVAIVLGGLAADNNGKYYGSKASLCETWADEAALSVSAKAAADNLREAARDWRCALNFARAARAEERARDIEARASEIDVEIAARKTEQRARQTKQRAYGPWERFQNAAQGNVFDQFDGPKGAVSNPDPASGPFDDLIPWDTKSVAVVWSEAHEVFNEKNGEFRIDGFKLDYALQNNTDHDITIPGSATIMQHLTKGGVLVAYSNVAKLRGATFLPARQRAQLSITLQWGCGVWDLKTNKIVQEEQPEACYARCFAGSDGLVLFDHANHLEVSLQKPIFPKPKR